MNKLSSAQKIEVLKFMQGMCAENFKKHGKYDLDKGALTYLAINKFDFLKSEDGSYSKEVYELVSDI